MWKAEGERPPIGAHMSIAGGVDRAILRGEALKCETVQIFVKSNVQWRMMPLRKGESRRFFGALEKSKINPVFAHSSYLINLASEDRLSRRRSIHSLKRELKRSAELGLPFLVLHPGCHGGSGEREGLRRIIGGLDEALPTVEKSDINILIEGTAGQGTSLGYRFEHLAEIISGVENQKRIGVCLDTCHLYAAGYEIRSGEGYHRVIDEFDRVVGLNKLRAIHLNDCKSDLGSRLDRHDHIGRGRLGKRAFARILNDHRLYEIPMVLETPKGKGMTWDRRNLAVLRKLRGC